MTCKFTFDLPHLPKLHVHVFVYIYAQFMIVFLTFAPFPHYPCGTVGMLVITA